MNIRKWNANIPANNVTSLFYFHFASDFACLQWKYFSHNIIFTVVLSGTRCRNWAFSVFITQRGDVYHCSESDTNDIALPFTRSTDKGWFTRFQPYQDEALFYRHFTLTDGTLRISKCVSLLCNSIRNFRKSCPGIELNGLLLTCLVT